LKQSFFSSLIFKIGVIIILLEVAVLVPIGIYYTGQFGEEVDNRVYDRIRIPGNLMGKGMLEYEVVKDRDQMREMVGDDLDEAMVVTVTQKIFYSLKAEYEGKNIDQVSGLSADWFSPSVKEQSIREVTENGNNYVVCVTPILAGESKKPYYFLYLKIFTNEAAGEKERIGALFMLGSLACVIVTSLTLLVTFRIMVSRRLSRTLDELKRFEEGELATRIDSGSSRDEIATLQNGFNSMATTLQERTEKQQKAEEELIKHREHLEELVKKRTSELEENTVELEKVNIRLQEADRLKSIFLASMSHELRTPLNSIIGFTGIILQGMSGEVSQEQRKQLTMVKNSASHLLSLINDLLDISKIGAGKVELLIEEFDLSALVREVENSFKVAAEEKDLKVSLRTPKGLTIKSDERRIKQVLVNLVGNAIKFTDKGKIEIKMTEKDGRVQIAVRDSGMGIRKEEMGRLFKAFSQISNEDRPKQEGTGLGLHLSKKILDLLGGEIKAQSEFGKGSVFTFTLPLKHEGMKG